MKPDLMPLAGRAMPEFRFGRKNEAGDPHWQSLKCARVIIFIGMTTTLSNFFISEMSSIPSKMLPILLIVVIICNVFNITNL